VDREELAGQLAKQGGDANPDHDRPRKEVAPAVGRVILLVYLREQGDRGRGTGHGQHATDGEDGQGGKQGHGEEGGGAGGGEPRGGLGCGPAQVLNQRDNQRREEQPDTAAAGDQCLGRGAGVEIPHRDQQQEHRACSLENAIAQGAPALAAVSAVNAVRRFRRCRPGSGHPIRRVDFLGFGVRGGFVVQHPAEKGLLGPRAEGGGYEVSGLIGVPGSSPGVLRAGIRPNGPIMHARE
jgi:hypothetical protein